MMEKVYLKTTKKDEAPIIPQYLRIDHWTDTDRFEIQIYRNFSGVVMPDRQLGNVILNRKDMEELAQKIQDYLQDLSLREAGQ